MESLGKELKEGPDERSAEDRFRISRSSMSKLEREFLLRSVVKHYTHLAHHPSAEGEIHFFSRSDAYMILAITSALVSRAAVRSQIN